MQNLYILDDKYRRIGVYDDYESLIWTERYAAFGDFELVTSPSRAAILGFVEGTVLAIDKSDRMMVVETIGRATNDDGVEMLTISGPSFESIFKSRTTEYAPASGTLALPSGWSITGTPQEIVKQVVKTRCITASNTPQDKIAYLTDVDFLPPGTIPPAVDTLTENVKPENLYDFIQRMCNVYGMGFRIARNGDTSSLSFGVYTGYDRTSTQSTNAAVIFSPALDTLSNPSELRTTADFKNVAYVFSANGRRTVYADNVDPATADLDRRALYVDASDITLPLGAALDAALDLRGRIELAKHRQVIAFDGETPQFSVYEYGTDYMLGDLVETRNSDGLTNNMRVTEQIFISDAEGERSYPTLSVDTLITPGTWYAWDASQVWDDAPGFWGDLP